MTLQKIKELYHDGDLVAEVFRNSYFVALLSSSHAYVRNKHYGLPKTQNFVALTSDDFSDISDAVEEWKEVKDELWGRRAHGSSMTGHTSTTYYPPHDEEGINVKKGENSEGIGVGELERKVEKGSLSFTLERFRLQIKRDDQTALLDCYQLPILEQVFILYKKRSGLYTPAEDQDFGSQLSWDA
ncbi:hypothetical protein ACFL3V_02100 [Nanoarchaeota archaeon]